MSQAFVRPLHFNDRQKDRRFFLLYGFFVLILVVCVLRLAKLQIADRRMYQLLASDQHDLQTKLMPDRGRILIRDATDNGLYPLASARQSWLVYGVPKNMTDPVREAHELSPVLGIADVDLIAKLTKKPDDPYEILVKDADYSLVQRLESMHLEGLGYTEQQARLYPEKGMGGQVVGLVTPDDQGNLVGRYGIESSFQEELAGKPGTLESEKDAAGRRIIFTDKVFRDAVDGADIVLTLDRSIQFQACIKVKQGVLDYEADSGTIVVMDPKTGAVLAMCSYPDFDPSNLKEVKDVSVFNNPATFTPYEPGSVFKAITMASGIEAGKVAPQTTYEDKGVEKIDDFEIKNSDGKANGIQTMQQVLEKSLNTGVIFVERQLGSKKFDDFVQRFGFGAKTDVGLKPEATGDISSLGKKGEIWAATASFGQGITATPIQLAAAYSALANQGKMMQPYIISEIDYPDGHRDVTQPQVKAKPVGAHTASLLGGMLVSVVENGHGKLASVPGYWIAAKTGTAQVAKKNGVGYEPGKIIATMAGFAPADDPKFVMIVKFDNPRKAAWAETCAAPVFGDMARYILNYYDIKPTR